MMTSQAIQHGQALIDTRSQTLKAAFIANPRRFKGKLPTSEPISIAACIDQPAPPAPMHRRRLPHERNIRTTVSLSI